MLESPASSIRMTRRGKRTGGCMNSGGGGWRAGADGWAEGKQAAQIVADPVRGDHTAAGLPVRVPRANTIGDPNRGFQQQMAQFQDERMVPVVTSPVSARHLWELTLAHARQRVAFGQPLASMQVNRFKFVEMMIQITAAQELAHRCIAKMTRGEDVTLDVSMAKVFCANMKQYVATTCVQLFGGSGYIWENPAARAFVDSRLSTIGGGADEVMKEVVAKLLKI